MEENREIKRKKRDETKRILCVWKCAWNQFSVWTTQQNTKLKDGVWTKDIISVMFLHVLSLPGHFFQCSRKITGRTRHHCEFYLERKCSVQKKEKKCTDINNGNDKMMIKNQDLFKSNSVEQEKKVKNIYICIQTKRKKCISLGVLNHFLASWVLLNAIQCKLFRKYWKMGSKSDTPEVQKRRESFHLWLFTTNKRQKKRSLSYKAYRVSGFGT